MTEIIYFTDLIHVKYSGSGRKPAYRNHKHLSLTVRSYYIQLIEFVRILGDTVLHNLSCKR